MTVTMIVSVWGASLSTILAMLTFFDRTRARPIVRTFVFLTSRRALEKPEFITALVRINPREDWEERREFYVEFRAENHGTKPISLHHIYIDTPKNLFYVTPEGLPVVLEAQSRAVIMVQKEFFDDMDISTLERRSPAILEIGFVDGLDRRYAVPRRQLGNLLARSLELPTGQAVYKRKDDSGSKVLAFQFQHPAVVQPRSEVKIRRGSTMIDYVRARYFR